MYLFSIKIVTNINILSTSIGTRVISYRNYILIITIDNYYFELEFIIEAYRIKKTP